MCSKLYYYFVYLFSAIPTMQIYLIYTLLSVLTCSILIYIPHILHFILYLYIDVAMQSVSYDHQLHGLRLLLFPGGLTQGMPLVTRAMWEQPTFVTK